MADKRWCLNEAIEIAKKYAEGGSDKVTPDYVLEKAYEKLIELDNKAGE